jgi:hypothetical protein
MMPGIRKLLKGEFFSASVVTPIGALGLVIAASPPAKAPIPTKPCRTSSSRRTVFNSIPSFYNL